MRPLAYVIKPSLTNADLPTTLEREDFDKEKPG